MKFKVLNLKNNQNAAGRPKKKLIPKTPYIMLQKKKRTKSEIVQENFLSYLKIQINTYASMIPFYRGFKGKIIKIEV